MIKSLTVGNPLKLIIELFIPVMIGNIIQQLYNLLSSIFVGRFVGVDALAGVGSSTNLLFLIFGFVYGFCGGCGIVLAQRFGANRKKGIRLCITHSIYICSFVALIITIISMILTNFVLKLTGTPEKIFNYAATFATIAFLGTFSQMAFNMFAAILRGLGDNKSALWLFISSAILNILLDYLTIAILNLGVIGAAISTILAQLISSAIYGSLMFKRYEFLRPKKQDWKPSKRYSLTLIKISLPMALEVSVTSIGLLILQSSVNNFGTNTVAGFTIVMKIEDILIASFFALACAASSYVAQNFGAEKYDRIKKGAKISFFAGIIICAFFSIFLLMFWDFFVSLFIDKKSITPENIEMVKNAAKQYRDIAILNYPILCILVIFRCIVQSLGQTIIPMLSGFLELSARAFVTLFIAKIFNIGYTGICFASIFAWYAAAILNLVTYLKAQKNMFKIKKHYNPNELT